MQHHTHATRGAPPHMRNHHLANATAAPPPHIAPPIIMPQQPPTVTQPPPPQQHSQPQQQLANNGPGATAAKVSSTATAPHMREHQPRLKQHPQSMHSNSQMHKQLRQQHQHMNNNNNNHNSKNNYHQHQYNNNNPGNTAGQKKGQQQAIVGGGPPPQVPHQQYQQRHPPLPHPSHPLAHMPPHSHQQQPHHMRNYQQQQQIHHQYQQPAQFQKGYATNSNNYKSKYNNVGHVAPKIILQNPNRAAKAVKGRSQNTAAQANNIEITPTDTGNTAEEILIATKAGNNINITPADTTSAAITVEDVAVSGANPSSENLNEAKQMEGDDEEDDVPVKTEDVVINNDCSASAELESTSISHNKVLSNEDSSVTKNSKEKTPMCLVNELARFNKITHQYRLTNEKGPAHCKRFTVTLKLGDEEYSAEGFKIKKAQHLAAAEAIEKTKYKHPVPKISRRSEDGSLSRSNITPTVELNALAMKLGQQTYYLFDPRQVTPSDAVGPTSDGLIAPSYNGPPPTHPPHGVGDHLMPPHPAHIRMLDQNFVRRNTGGFLPPPMQHPGPHQRFVGGHRGFMPRYQRYSMMPPLAGGAHNVLPPSHPHVVPSPFGLPTTPCKVTLIVGKQKFIGSGRTLQQAKHDAAARALQVLKEQATTQLNEMLNSSLEESDSKSPISLVHEIGIKRSMTVHFKVLREDGPAHMKNFITACIVGNIVTEGEGNGKKISKKRAAEKMLEELKKLPPLTPTKSPVRRMKVKVPTKPVATTGAAATTNAKGGERRRRAVTSIKEQPDTDGDLENPITRLIQLQQNRKGKEPAFELIAKNGNENSRRREFIVEVTAQGMVARGTGNSKKLAKRNAAQNLLNAMNADSDTENSSKNSAQTPADTGVVPTLETNDTAGALASIVEPGAEVPHVATPAGQIPGILILRQNKKRDRSLQTVVVNTEINMNKKEELPIVTTTTESNLSETVKVTTTSATDVVNDMKVNSEENVVTTSVESAPITNTEKCNKNSTPASTAPATSTSNTSVGVHMKDQLLYLAKLLGFEVNFSDYPKGNHSEFLTIVTLSSNPPQICHGVGTSSEESQNDAAKNALKILSELGLNSAVK